MFQMSFISSSKSVLSVGTKLYQQQLRITATFRYRSTIAVPQDAVHNTPRPFSDIPGPKSYPIIKNALYNIFRLPTKFTDFYGTACHLYKNFGEIVRWELPFVPKMVFLFTPETMETFLKEGVTEHPERAPIVCFETYRKKIRKDIYGDSAGIVIENGRKWYDVRSRVQQTMMRPKTSTLYIPAMDAIATDFIEKVKSLRDEKLEMPKDFQNELYKWALESVAIVALNTRMGCLDPNLSADSDGQIMITAVNQILDDASVLEFDIPYWRVFPSKRWRSFVKHMDDMSKIGMKYIDKAAETLNKKKVDDLEEMNMLERFLMTPGLSKGNAYTMAMDMLFAGVDTTGNSMGYLLYCIAKNPDCQRKLQAEIDRVMPNKNEPVTLQQLNSLTYLKACIKESMRIHPVAGAFGRTAQKDVVIRGHSVPKGTFVISNTMLMSRLDKYYPEPMKFRPERWLRGHSEQTDASPYTYIPFGHGVRMCIGRRIAEQEMWVLTTKLLQNFDVEYHYKDMGYITRLVNVPSEPLQFRFIDRKR